MHVLKHSGILRDLFSKATHLLGFSVAWKNSSKVIAVNIASNEYNVLQYTLTPLRIGSHSLQVGVKRSALESSALLTCQFQVTESKACWNEGSLLIKVPYLSVIVLAAPWFGAVRLYKDEVRGERGDQCGKARSAAHLRSIHLLRAFLRLEVDKR
ncbi:hypothetical protein E2C01_007990 [Portunus trituberculatus]|uniref:Uncharacterized protein n=1 Tax=Portunus trituberculatus TaxID=210409 RepID=A0A5B7D3R4_PORTR|nr:hypothetical protein [Portunus trituberculatus]